MSNFDFLVHDATLVAVEVWFKRVNDFTILPNDFLTIPGERGGCIAWHIQLRFALRCRVEEVPGSPQRLLALKP